jgi:hypothetical protein
MVDKLSRNGLLGTAMAIAAAVSAYTVSPALANQDMCEQARQVNLSDIDARLGTPIINSDKQIADMTAKGLNPEDIAIRLDGKFYTSPELRARLAQDRDTAKVTVNAKADKCNADLAPYQQAMNTAVSTLTGGVSDLLPGKMAYVDVSRILAGYPGGGPDAFVPKFREQVLVALGATGSSNDLKKILENPAGGRCSFVRNPFGNGC